MVRPSWTCGSRVPYLAGIDAVRVGGTTLVAVVVATARLSLIARAPAAVGVGFCRGGPDFRTAETMACGRLCTASRCLHHSPSLRFALEGNPGLSPGGGGRRGPRARDHVLSAPRGLAHTLGRVPLLVRFLPVPALSYAIVSASGLLTAASRKSYSFSPMVVCVLLSLALASVLLSSEVRRRQLRGVSQNGRTRLTQNAAR